MKFKKLFASALASSLLGIAAVTFGLVGSANAACSIQYNPNGFNTPTTPIFNAICGAPGVGDESDFVRIRQNVNGDPTDNQNNPNYTGDTLNAACNNGDKFDVWNYLHNDATDTANNNGAGTAVAKNVQMHLTALLGQSSNSFAFGDTVSADNAASVHDVATLRCGSKFVKLNIVHDSVKIFSTQYTGWLPLGDNTLNNTTKIGSPTPGSGVMWGCWQYRILVVYQVQVEEIPQQQPQSLVCDALTLTNIDNKNRKLHAKVTATAQGGATISGYSINWGDSNTENVQENDHQFADFNKEYTITGTVTGTVNGQPKSDSTNCVQKITFTTTEEKCTTPGKENLPKNSPQCAEVVKVTKLIDTGPEDTVGIFGGVTALGYVAHRLRTLRRIGRK